MSATPIDWTRVKAVFDAALILDAPARSAYIADACGADAVLRQQVEALLVSHGRAEAFLETPAAALIDRSADTLPGRTVESYRIIARVGGGAMGEVYKAHDAKLDRDVALKLLPLGAASNPDRLRRFHAEARAASSLNHPNILVIHDFGALDGRPFIISEFVDGETLRQRLQRAAVPVREAVGIAIQIANALMAAHARGIVHRDIKPDNVMLRPDRYVKVVDFGLAKLFAEPAAGSMIATLGTQAGVLLGTPHYMSPEQAEGKEVDGRSDLFSLGVILFELTTGARPFTGDSHLSVLSSILRDTPTSLTELNPALPPDLERIVRHCLAKDRDRRYQSATDLRNDLEELERSLRAEEAGPPAAIARAIHRHHAESVGIESLAVLPFANASGDPETEYLSDGVTESLINRLSQIPSLRVVPRSITSRYKGRDVDPNEVGRQLKVRAVLTGKVLQRGDALNVQAELVDVSREAQLWGERFVRRVSDIFAVEDEIAGQITDRLRVKVTGQDHERLGRRDTENTEAYRLFLKGRYYWNKRTRPNLQKSVTCFEQAIALDPGYALPHAGLADAYVVMSVFDAGVPGDLLSKAKAAAGRALASEPDLPEAHAELCLIWPSLDRDWDAADDAFQRAMKRQPSYWLAHDHYAFVLAAQGRFDEAVAEVRRGQAREPLSLVVHHHVAWVCVLARRYDDAIAECRSAIDMDPTFPMAHLWMGVALEQKGLYDEAIAALEEAVKWTGGVTIAAGAAGHAYAMAGRLEEARRRLTELTHARVERYLEPYGIALVAAALGDRDAALRWLEQGYQEHSFWLAMWSKVDPRLDPLRDDPRFQDLLRRLGLTSN
jgi:serine/threonine protein kinase/tetratricopeptide (TPR) repeat protein